MNIVEAIKHPDLFLPYFDNDLSSWKPWLYTLRAIYGLPIRSKYGKKIIRKLTGRDPDKLNPDGYQTALILTGRRSGKSRISAVIGAHAATLAGLDRKLSPGEQGLIAVVSPTKKQGTVVRNYVRSLFDVPLLKREIVKERSLDTFTMKSGTRLEILASDYRSVRGFTLLGVVVDEACFLGLGETSRVSSDTVLIRSLEPALATTGGKLIAISSPYARSGWAHETWKKHYGCDDSRDVLVIQAPSKVMNSTLPQKVIDRALKEDYASARSEYFAEFRDDVYLLFPADLVERQVVTGRLENLPRNDVKYHAFVDLSGGRGDSAVLCIAHREDRKVIQDFEQVHPSPHNPYLAIDQMCQALSRFGIRKVVADAYAGEFAAAAFTARGVAYEKCPFSKSILYQELLPVFSAERLELLDSPRLVKQLCSLERRTRSGARDSIDHPPNMHDDVSNAFAGAVYLANAKPLRAGAGGF